jgi:hypothetical protein
MGFGARADTIAAIQVFTALNVSNCLGNID